MLIGSTIAGLAYGAWRAPAGRVAKAAPLLSKMRAALPFIPASDEKAVRLNGAVQTAAGVALITGVAPRLASTTLVLTLIPTTLAGHAFWKIKDPAARRAQRMQFQKNAAIIGGLILSAEAPARRRRRRKRSAKVRGELRGRR